MKKQIAVFLVLLVYIVPLTGFAQKGGFVEMKQLQGPQNPRLGFIIHGGAGVIRKGSLSPEREKEYRDKLQEAVLAGYKALQAGKSSLDAVEIAIKILEDSPLFNAGKGAVFTNDGKNELDASIMDGKTQAAGAVAGVHRVKNPITLARAIMERSEHVMMIGEGAEKFATEQKIELVDPKYFWTQPRWDALQRILKQEKEKNEKVKEAEGEKGQSEKGTPDHQSIRNSQTRDPHSEKPEGRFGTVGAVALDKDGNLAAGTSTGGMTNKKFGRVGDAPIIGAGTYANNNSCAVSATGWGEYFIRLSVARDIASLMEYRALPIQQAADLVIKQKLQNLGGDGGVIAMDKFGNIGVSFNSEGMYRAYINADGKPVVEIYND
ncbi:MAG: isoaspartyl peptidase/L-asparaginase [Acidobacteria bacterium]|nr:isoaspartyl peptidase/L-asparaginase [Acidobacteriota bacterium]